MAKITLKQLADRLVVVQKFLTGTDGDGQHPFMAEDAKKLRTNPRSLFSNKVLNVAVLKKCAKTQIDKHKAGSETRQSAVYNFNTLTRFAEVMNRLEKDTKELEITEMESIYFKDEVPEPRVVNADYAFMTAQNPIFYGSLSEILMALMDSNDAKAKAEAEKKKGGGKKRDKKRSKKRKKEREEPEEAPEEGDSEQSPPPVEEAAPAQPSGKKSWLPSFNREGVNYKKLGMIVVAIIVVLALINFGALDFITGGTSDATTTNTTYVDPNGAVVQYNPDGTAVIAVDPLITQPPAGQVQLTSEAQGLQSTVKFLFALLKEGKMVAMILLCLGGLILIMFDRAAHFEVEDFYVTVGILAAYTVMVLLTNGNISILTIAGWQINMDMFLTLLLAGGLLIVALLGNRDFTVVSVGLFLAGNILFITNLQAFAAFQPPPVVMQSWAIGALVQLIEMIRQENTAKSIFIGAIGIVVQALFFFVIVSKLATASDPFIVAHVQVIAYMSAIVLTFIGIVGIMFTGLKTDVFKNINGIQNTISTAMFDVGVVANCFGALGLMLYIW